MANTKDKVKDKIDEASDIFERLRATPWLERVDKLGVGRVETATRS